MSIEELFVDAVTYYTGNNFRPDISSYAWKTLIRKLKDTKIRPGVFCYYVVTKGGTCALNPLLLMYKSLITSDSFWNEFMLYRELQEKRIKVLVHLQKERIRTHLKFYKNKLELLNNETFPVNSIVRIDTALEEAIINNLDIQELISKYLEDALLLLRGSPEYMVHCFMFKNYCLKNDLWKENIYG